MAADEQAVAEPRWIARPGLAFGVRAVSLAAPVLAGAGAGLAVATAVARPSGPAFLAWLAVLLGTSCLAVAIVERWAKRLLPLATLLNLSLAFPDRVPSRFRVARAAGSPRVLEDRIRHAREHGLDDDPSRAAESILTLVAALSAHDRKTRGHSERVRAFTDMLAAEIGVAPADRDRLRWAALLHDIGKLEVPPTTLNKAGKPNQTEWAQIERHPLEGKRIAAPLLPWLGEWGEVIAQHHERHDGGGYPAGLRGTEISLGARIVTLADAFEVMTSPRSYKRPMTPAAARRELARCAGAQFDPDIVRAFFALSIGRLWGVVGPVSWLAHLPLALRLARTGDRAVTVARSASGVAMQAAAGALAVVLFGSPVPRQQGSDLANGSVRVSRDGAGSATDAAYTATDGADPSTPPGGGSSGPGPGESVDGAPADLTTVVASGDATSGDGSTYGPAEQDRTLVGSTTDAVVDAVDAVGDTVDGTVDAVGDVVTYTAGPVGGVVDVTTDTTDEATDVVSGTVDTLADTTDPLGL
jgi:putative nucleotidyltransferase with HDIG domain